MTDVTKKWYASKTIWGILIAAIGYVASEVLKVPDVQLPQNADFNQMKAYVDAINASNGNLSVIISQVVSAIGTILAIIGRVKAGQKIA
jgi:hypothetical protein